MATVFSLTWRLLKALNLLVITLLWLMLCGLMAFKMAEPGHMRDALPAELEVDGVEWIAGEDGFRESCGVAVFRLALSTRQRLHEQGLKALATALHGRGHGDDEYYRYQPWQTPPGGHLFGGEGWPALFCGNVPSGIRHRIYRGLYGPDGYITSKDEAVLLVLPREGLVVYGYDG